MELTKIEIVIHPIIRAAKNNYRAVLIMYAFLRLGNPIYSRIYCIGAARGGWCAFNKLFINVYLILESLHDLNAQTNATVVLTCVITLRQKISKSSCFAR